MALLAFHFSKAYKEKLLSGKKRHTIVDYPLALNVGQKVLIYLSTEDNVEDSKKAVKTGTAIVTKVITIKVSDINDENAQRMGHDSRNEIINSMRKWYKINNKSIISYIEFKLNKDI